jgi:hypothetical protein
MLVCVLAGLSCATVPLKKRASMDLGCPEDGLAVKDVDAETKAVQGCGKQAMYRSHNCTSEALGTDCVWDPISQVAAAPGTQQQVAQQQQTDQLVRAAREACYAMPVGQVFAQTYALVAATFPVTGTTENAVIDTDWGLHSNIARCRLHIEFVGVGSCVRVVFRAEAQTTDEPESSPRMATACENAHYIKLHRRLNGDTGAQVAAVQSTAPAVPANVLSEADEQAVHRDENGACKPVPGMKGAFRCIRGLKCDNGKCVRDSGFMTMAEWKQSLEPKCKPGFGVICHPKNGGAAFCCADSQHCKQPNLDFCED